MLKHLLLLSALGAAVSAQSPNAPNTNPKPVNDPTNTNNLSTDPTVPGGAGSGVAVGHPGLGSNPSAGISDQLREAADQTFATNLSLQTLTELELGKLASEHASNDAVKALAVRMMESNSKMNERLKRVASRGSITIPNALDARNQSRVDKLSKLTGDEFDRGFLRDQVQSNERNLRAFEQEIQSGSDPGLRALATRATPVAQKQLQDAKDLEKTLKTK